MLFWVLFLGDPSTSILGFASMLTVEYVKKWQIVGKFRKVVRINFKTLKI